jgi:hypothetical protein
MTTRPDPAPTNDNAALAEERAEWMESVDGLIAARGINPAGRLLDDVAGSINVGIRPPPEKPSFLRVILSQRIRN